jgi:hypothetical protein
MSECADAGIGASRRDVHSRATAGSTPVQGTHGVDAVCLAGALVVAVAQYPGESQRQTAGVARGLLHAVECHLDLTVELAVPDLCVAESVRQ